MQNQDIADALHDVWGWMNVSPPEYTLNRSMRLAEPVVHEICHAVSLGFPLKKGAPDRVTNYFDSLNERSRILGLTTEAHAFAIGQRVLRHFGWLRYVRYHALMRDVYRTGYSGPCLPYRSFLSLYRRMLAEQSTQDLAVQAIDYIYRVTRRKRQLKKGSKQ